MLLHIFCLPLSSHELLCSVSEISQFAKEGTWNNACNVEFK